jgi:hypothetical protein
MAKDKGSKGGPKKSGGGGTLMGMRSGFRNTVRGAKKKKGPEQDFYRILMIVVGVFVAGFMVWALSRP